MVLNLMLKKKFLIVVGCSANKLFKTTCYLEAKLFDRNVE